MQKFIRPQPAFVIVSDTHLDAITAELDRRYGRDYRLVGAGDPEAATARVSELLAEQVPIAVLIAPPRVADVPGVRVLAELHALVPTARRLLMAPVAGMIRDYRDEVLEAQVRGEVDSYLLLPQGPRDEEFHTAMAEMLSEWAWSANAPEVLGSLLLTDDPGSRRSAQLRDFADRMGIPLHVVDAASEKGRRVREHVGRPVALPALIVAEEVLEDPSLAQIGDLIFGAPGEHADDIVDLLVVGAGPAGLGAAVYGASEGLSTLVVECEAIGGQAGTSSMIRNYLGFPRGISGMRLAQRARMQAVRFGARFAVGRKVGALTVADGPGGVHRVRLGELELSARAVLIATGVSYRRLGVQPLEDLIGRGVQYGAATSTARDMSGRRVYVVGGGNSAGQAAVHLARFAREVSIVIRRASLKASMSDYLIREIDSNPRINVLSGTEVVDGGGAETLEWLTLADCETGQRRRVEAHGLYLLLGADPHCEWLPEQVHTDGRGFVCSGGDVPQELWPQGRPPSPLSTSVPGVFVAGDIRSGSMKRVAAASGEGAGVVAQVHAFLDRA